MIAAGILAVVVALIIGYVSGMKLANASARWCPGCGRTRDCSTCDGTGKT
ncbi:hypothetical protein [Actinoplanes sp. L3-i22]|nr:hypothetical protein [Actinoplanes sp. L3-i22]